MIRLRGELVTFNFNFPKIPNDIISMISGPSGHVHDPQTQLFLNILDFGYTELLKMIQA